MKKGPQMPMDDMKKKEAPPQVLVSSSQLTHCPRCLGSLPDTLDMHVTSRSATWQT